DVAGLGGEPLRQRAAVRDAGHVDPPGVDLREVDLDLGDHRADEADVVDVAALRGSAARAELASARVPRVTDALRPDRDEALRVAELEDARRVLLAGVGRREAVHVD